MNTFLQGKSFTAKYKSGYKEWLAQELVTPVTARSAPQ